MPEYKIEQRQVNSFKNIINCLVCNNGQLKYTLNLNEKQVYYICNNCGNEVKWDQPLVHEIEYSEIKEEK